MALQLQETSNSTSALREMDEAKIRRLATVVLDSNDAITIQDFEGHITAWNHGAELMYGYSEKEALQKNIWLLTPPNREEEQKDFTRRMRAGEAITSMETQRVTKDGRILDIWMTVTKLVDDNGKPISIASTERDITGRKKKETELAAEQKLYRELFENANIGILRTTPGPEGAFIDVNPTMVRMFEADSREQLMALHPSKLYWDESQRKIIGDAIVAKGFIDDEVKYKTLKGKPIWCRIHGTKRIDADGRIYFDNTIENITDRKQAEETLWFKNQVFDASITANSIANMSGNITETNDAFLRVWGYSCKDEVLGKSLLHFINDPNEAGTIVTALNNIGQWEGDYTAQRKDGSTFIAFGLATAIKDMKGTVIGYQSSVIDVTAQRDADRELKEHRDHLEQLVKERTTELKKSEEKFRTVSDFTYDWEYWVDPERQMLYVSPSCERVTGFPPEKFYQDPRFIDTLIHPEDKNVFEKHVDSFHYGQRHEEACEIEFRIVSRDGSVKWMDHACRPVLGEDRTYKGQRVSNRDITASKKIEERLLRLQEEQQIILDSIPAWVFYKDKENRFIRVNNAFAKVMEMSREQIEGKTCFDFYPKEQAEAFLRDDLAVIDSGKPKRNIIEPMDSPKGTVWVQTDKIPYRDAQGKIIGIIGFTLDITERKKAEMAIQGLNEDIRRKMFELEVSNSELEAFSYSVSHDLRAPLRTIGGFSQIVMDDYSDKVDEQGRNYLLRIKSATQRMGQLIDDMLKLSRISRQELKQEPVDLSMMARKISAELFHNQPERQVEFVIAPGCVENCDQQLIEIALENLMGNSWKYSSRHPSATIEFGATEKEGKTVYFVRDNGAGFDPAYADKLFAPFQRLHAASEFEGNGIGLATIQRIVRKHGGSVWAEGQVEKGAVFYFTLK